MGDCDQSQGQIITLKYLFKLSVNILIKIMEPISYPNWCMLTKILWNPFCDRYETN